MNTIAALPNNPLQYVSIDSGTGAISLSRSLDFENLRELSLLIIASDGLNTDVSSLTISVNNVNDNDPTLSSKFSILLKLDFMFNFFLEIILTWRHFELFSPSKIFGLIHI